MTVQLSNLQQSYDTYHDQGYDFGSEMHMNILKNRYQNLEATELLQPLIQDELQGKIAVSSSFGAESAILLHMVSQIDVTTPVLFIDTGKLFQKTIEYRDTVAEFLGLQNIKIISPDQKVIENKDGNGDLWKTSPDLCCEIRKVHPFEHELSKYSAVITGRKRYQANTRSTLDMIEHDGKQIKINPIARWDIQKLQNYMVEHNLPAHPLVSEGYLSIGCEPCTSKVKAGEDPRAGRWRGKDKTECGIHYVNGKMVRVGA